MSPAPDVQQHLFQISVQIDGVELSPQVVSAANLVAALRAVSARPLEDWMSSVVHPEELIGARHAAL